MPLVDSVLGTPLTELRALSTIKTVKPKSSRTTMNTDPEKKHLNSCFEHNTTAISFVRTRMLYARPALNAKGKVTFGLRHIRSFISLFCRPIH